MSTTRLTDPTSGHFPTDPAGLPEAQEPELVELADGDRLELRIAPVAKRIGEATVRMVAYNGSIPGPTLKVPQGSEIVVNVVNDGDLEATVHWHGLRLDNRFDGTHETQAPIPVGGSFSYRVRFPDPGLYWYHPHIREDYGQEMGLYANILVVPAEADYWPPAHRDLVLTLDDIELENGKVAPFRREETTYVAMGRFGNTMLISGEPQLTLEAKQGEVVRFYLTNTANTRVFNVRVRGGRMKPVGGDSGRYEREQFVDEVLLAPSERAIVDVLFEQSGTAKLEHHTPEKVYELATITVSDEPATPALSDQFGALRTAPELAREREQLDRYIAAGPDKTLAFIAEMDLGTPEGAVVYACPMHPDVVSETPDKCPKCGMKLLPTATTYVCPMHPEVVSETPDKCPKCGMKLLPAQLVAAAGGHEHHHGHGADDHQGHGHGAHGGDSHDPDSHGHQAHSHPGDGHSHHQGHGGSAPVADDQPAAGHSRHGHHSHHGHGSAASDEPDVAASEDHSHHHGHGHSAPADEPTEPRAAHSHHDHGGHGADHAHAHGAAAGGIEWEDDMVDVNRMTTPANMRWKIVDRTNGADSPVVDWQFKVGDRVKIRLVNEMESDHPMHHPFHIHGAGRFLILSRDGVVEPNLVWKDTVLVRTGETVDILLDVSEPGVWMAHCHIAEHHESGMMFVFNVSANEGDAA